MRAAQIYQETFGTKDGRIPATFDMIYLIGWSPHESQQQPMEKGSAEISLKTVLAD